MNFIMEAHKGLSVSPLGNDTTTTVRPQVALQYHIIILGYIQRLIILYILQSSLHACSGLTASPTTLNKSIGSSVSYFSPTGQSLLSKVRSTNNFYEKEPSSFMYAKTHIMLNFVLLQSLQRPYCCKTGILTNFVLCRRHFNIWPKVS